MVNLKINDEIIGSHGLFDEGGEHSDHKYKVTGILEPSGTVLDRLIITSVNSVLDIHGQEHINDHDGEKNIMIMKMILSNQILIIIMIKKNITIIIMKMI